MDLVLCILFFAGAYSVPVTLLIVLHLIRERDVLGLVRVGIILVTLMISAYLLMSYAVSDWD